MTKPKTTVQLLAEANKLAKERGLEIEVLKTPVGYLTGESHWNVTFGRVNGTWIRLLYFPSEHFALRCLIAALREVPVKGGKK